MFSRLPFGFLSSIYLIETSIFCHCLFKESEKTHSKNAPLLLKKFRNLNASRKKSCKLAI